jgi:hypothetical protein
MSLSSVVSLIGISEKFNFLIPFEKSYVIIFLWSLGLVFAKFSWDQASKIRAIYLECQKELSADKNLCSELNKLKKTLLE